MHWFSISKGTIDSHELDQALRKLHPGSQLPVSALMKEADTDGDGKIDFFEFKRVNAAFETDSSGVGAAAIARSAEWDAVAGAVSRTFGLNFAMELEKQLEATKALVTGRCHQYSTSAGLLAGCAGFLALTPCPSLLLPSSRRPPDRGDSPPPVASVCSPDFAC